MRHSVRHTAARFLMFVQKRHSGEGFGAVFALVFLYVRVGLQMCPQVRPVCKSSVAVRARERLLPCVSSNVSLKQPGSGESLATDLADTRQGVGPNVHLKGTQAHIFLVTVFAAERLPRLGITMQLLMFGQPRESRIGLIA